VINGFDPLPKIEKIILEQGWDFIIALKCSRGVKSVFEYKNTPKSGGWADIATFFWRLRRLKQVTMGNHKGLPLHFFTLACQKTQWRIKSAQLSRLKKIFYAITVLLNY